MKCLYFLLLVAASQAYVPRNTREIQDIPAPTITRLTVLSPPGFEALWTPVKSLDNSDPIIGYKLKVWELSGTKQFHYETINGIKVLVEDDLPAKFPYTDKIPDSEPREILIDGADKTTARVDQIKLGVKHEIRVQAYTKTKEGPLSQPMRIELHPPSETNDRNKDVYIVS